MAGFKVPTYQDRVAAAAATKQKALDRLKAKPPVDEATLAERRRVAEERAKVIAEERAVKAAVAAKAREEKAAKKAADLARKAAELAELEEAATLKAARLKPATAEEMKAARDARYAARKARSG